MTWIDFLLIAVKAIIVVHFGMLLGVLLTWTDRRQGSMMQDRIGPHRAVAWLPQRLAQAVLVGPALLSAAAILAWAFLPGRTAALEGRDGALLSQAAVLATWLTAVAVAARVKRVGAVSAFDRLMASAGDPRRFVYAGFLAHALLFLAALQLGLASRVFVFLLGASAAVLALVIVVGAAFAAASLKDDKVGLRLAGILHGAADGLKTIFKEDFIPPGADRFLHSLAPLISFFPILVVLAVVPFGDTLCFGGDAAGDLDITAWVPLASGEVCRAPNHAVPLQIATLNVGLLYFFAMAGTGIVGAALAGWASDNKFSLLGGLRAASQMVSYEVTLGLTLVGAIMLYGTVRIDEMVRWQADHAWGVFVQPLGFVLFFAAAIAETKRIPFDLPEGESELVAGYFTEYSGMKFAMFFFSEYVAIVTSSALMVAVFLGGYDLPFLTRAGVELSLGGHELALPLSYGVVVALGFVAFVLKTVALCVFQLAIRWTLPRFRYDQLMRLGWRVLLPVSLANVVVTGLVAQGVQSAGPVVEGALQVVATFTQWVVVVVFAGLSAWLISFVLTPATKRRLVVSSAARYAEALGGTPTTKLGT